MHITEVQKKSEIKKNWFTPIGRGGGEARNYNRLKPSHYYFQYSKYLFAICIIYIFKNKNMLPF